MFSRFRFLNLMCVFACVYTLPCVHSRTCADQPVIRFDVPALLPVHELVAEGIAPVSAHKIIEVVIPVTSEIRQQDRQNIDEFRFDVSWSRHRFPVADYAPKSKVVSHIDGPVTVSQTDDSGGSISLNGSTDRLEFLALNSQGDLTNRKQVQKSFQEIPQHRALVASGTIKRGTGIFFRFHPARAEMLEGGREVVIAWRVARNWTGGVLKVECRVNGQRKLFGTLKEPIEVAQAFTVPIYLEGHASSLTAATNFVRAETALKQAWRNANVPQKHVSFRWPVADLPIHTFRSVGHSYPSKPAKRSTSPPQSEGLPQQWVHHLIQSGNDQYLKRYQSMLPKNVQTSAAVFVAARQALMAMSK